MTTPEIIEHLKKLREAAAANDWNGYHVALPPLLLALPASDAIEFALAQFRAYLPRFERAHPDAAWPRQRLHKLAVSGPGYRAIRVQPWLTDARQEYQTPGSERFVLALERVWQAAFSVDQPDVRVAHLVAAVIGVRLADLEEAWYGPRPEAWEQWLLALTTPVREDSAGPRAASKIGITFGHDPAIRQRETAAWLEVADELERRIQAAHSEPDMLDE
jgi:hypothetical protein